MARIAAEEMAPYTQQLAGLFDYAHLPDHLADRSKPFAALAATMLQTLPDGPMLRSALVKLWESKNLAVVAALSPAGEPTR